MKRSLAIAALCGALALGACSDNQTAGTATPAGATRPRGAQQREGRAAQPAAAPQEPDYPQPAVVIPPRPKPGAPHGPGFDMPLIDVGGYMPARPMDVLKDAHVFTADHPEVASYVPCYCGCGSAGHKNNADCFVKGRDARRPRHRVGAARRVVRGLHRHRRRFDEDEELGRIGHGDSQEGAGRLPPALPDQRNADSGPAAG